MTGTIVVAGVFIVLLRERVGRLIEQLTDAASTDPLTGLLNRRGFQSVIDNELARAERSGQPFSLLLCDCDFFKHLNDRLGHHAGDEALQAIGRMLEVNKRRIDVAARVGGEEFALVLPETDQHEAFIVAERLRSRFAESFADQPVPLTMSLGVATYPTHGIDRRRAAARRRRGALRRQVAGPRPHRALQRRGRRASSPLGGAGGQRPRPGSAGDGPQPRRGAGHARHRHGAPLPDRRPLLRADGARAGPDRASRWSGSGSPACCTTSARSACPTRSCASPARSPRTSTTQMKKHPEIGARILGGSGLNDIRELGAGPPRAPRRPRLPAAGLADDEIPLEAKILAVADSYEAMTSDRVYRKAIGARGGARAARGVLGHPVRPAGRRRVPARARSHRGAGDALRAVVATRQRTRLEPIWTLMSG